MTRPETQGSKALRWKRFNRWFSFKILAALASAVGIFAVLSLGSLIDNGWSLQNALSGADSKAEILLLYERLPLGSLSQEVEAIIEQGDWKYLSIVSRNDSEWRIGTPLTITASGYLVFLEFKDGVLVAVRIRTLDSNRSTPENMPLDKVLTPP